ncbi:hypothetical protein OSB04_018500 [Centaurea solstitialis]|uniref:Protein kinase domain-containing protein n=1 Tax=Centaurea solstitialis TaxID=347529 RepID=A0AA38TGU6_9ASTR|nr:hypothetical protein OSB04_018500 [Centaurea solstitialis]
MGNDISKLNRKSHVKPSSEKSQGKEDLYEINIFHPHRIHRFCYKVLKAATGKFSHENLAGQGGCGDVYKGWLDYRTKDAVKPGHGFPVGVKRIKKEGSQGLEEWKLRGESFKSTELNWRKRIKIAKGLARGLEYLHTREITVIRRDIKSA